VTGVVSVAPGTFDETDLLGDPSVLREHAHELEHRWGERFPANLRILIATDVISSAAGIIRNVSMSGALIQTGVELRLRSLVSIRLESSLPSRRSTLILAHVVRKGGDGVGVEFCDFAPRAVKDLLRSLSSQVDRGRDAEPPILQPE
jgi:hypothetical protein